MKIFNPDNIISEGKKLLKELSIVKKILKKIILILLVQKINKTNNIKHYI